MVALTPTIKVLPPHMTALIAAGEVVERPAAVVKELLENALDAGAKAISIEVQAGGLARIRVSDDGHGMNRPDAPLALQPFATSKISAPADLTAINSYGFRGEALSSLAAVAQLDILTRTEAELEGTRLTSHSRPGVAGEKEITVVPAASPVGTSVTVSDLFAAVPARRKFLKAPLRELELLQGVVERYALARPETAFRLLADGRARLILSPGSRLERIAAVFGREVVDQLVPVDWQAMDLRVSGYVSSPAIARSRRDRQFFFVNGRPIRSGLLAVMLERPYLGRLPPGRHPLAIISIEVDPGFVDLNVHPQKAEVRFSRERSIYGALSQAVNDALTDYPRSLFDEADTFSWPFAELENRFQPLDPAALREGESPYQAGPLRPLAQIHATYILAQADTNVLIIDQHAAHEQILYEQLVTQTPEARSIEPLHIQLTVTELALWEANLSLFRRLGFDLEPFGGQTIVLRAIPVPLQPHLSHQVSGANQPLEAALLTTLLAELADNKRLDVEAQLDKLAQKAACVCAVKAGDLLSDEVMETLLTDLSRIWSPAACPHGRPVFVNLSLSEIERRFGRR